MVLSVLFNYSTLCPRCQKFDKCLDLASMNNRFGLTGIGSQIKTKLWQNLFHWIKTTTNSVKQNQRKDQKRFEFGLIYSGKLFQNKTEKDFTKSHNQTIQKYPQLILNYFTLVKYAPNQPNVKLSLYQKLFLDTVFMETLYKRMCVCSQDG